MARRKKKSESTNPEDHADVEGTGTQTNAGQRREAINAYFETRYNTDKKIEAAVERHVKPLRDERNQVNKEFRNDYGFREADLHGQYLDYKRRRDIELFDDEGEREQASDNMHEIYEALYGDEGQMAWNFPTEGGVPADTSADFLTGEAAGSA